jgi:hypothetical protein
MPRLARLELLAQKLEGGFDMPGFRPRPEYLREMKRYGILPAAFDEVNEEADPYAIDRRYWDSFIYCPTKPSVR